MCLGEPEESGGTRLGGLTVFLEWGIFTTHNHTWLSSPGGTWVLGRPLHWASSRTFDKSP